MSKKYHIISFILFAGFLAFADDLPLEKWSASKNTNIETDSNKKFENSRSMLLTRKEQSKFSIETEVSNLVAKSSYIFGFYFIPDEKFVKGYGKIGVTIKLADEVFMASWKGAMPANKWSYLNLRFDTALEANAKIKIVMNGPGSICLARAGLDKLNPPDEGLDLSSQYMQIPFGTRVGNKIFDHLDLKEGTIEFWLRPHWKAIDARHFEDKNVRKFFFWGSQQYENSISIYSWNKFPNFYFDLCGKNHKQGRSVFYYNTPMRGWRKNTWHHIAASWKQNGEKTRIILFVDGMPCHKKNADTIIARYLKRDLFLGAGKKHRELMIGNAAGADMALFRISKKQKYDRPFIPQQYELENDTLSFFPLNKNKSLGFFITDEGKKEKIKAEIYKINNPGKDVK
jgi:hypothetical protein